MLEMVLGATVVLVLARFAWLEEDKRGWGILKRPSKNQISLKGPPKRIDFLFKEWELEGEELEKEK